VRGRFDAVVVGAGPAGSIAALVLARSGARVALADLPLRTFLNEQVVPYERDEVTRLIVDTHDAPSFHRSAPAPNGIIAANPTLNICKRSTRELAERSSCMPPRKKGSAAIQFHAFPPIISV